MLAAGRRKFHPDIRIPDAVKSILIIIHPSMVHAIRKKGLINFHSVKMYRGQNNMSAVLCSGTEIGGFKGAPQVCSTRSIRHSFA
jgi:hypothetical protein